MFPSFPALDKISSDFNTMEGIKDRLEALVQDVLMTFQGIEAPVLLLIKNWSPSPRICSWYGEVCQAAESIAQLFQQVADNPDASFPDGFLKVIAEQFPDLDTPEKVKDFIKEHRDIVPAVKDFPKIVLSNYIRMEIQESNPDMISLILPGESQTLDGSPTSQNVVILTLETRWSSEAGIIPWKKEGDNITIEKCEWSNEVMGRFSNLLQKTMLKENPF